MNEYEKMKKALFGESYCEKANIYHEGFFAILTNIRIVIEKYYSSIWRRVTLAVIFS